MFVYITLNVIHIHTYKHVNIGYIMKKTISLFNKKTSFGFVLNEKLENGNYNIVFSFNKNKKLTLTMKTPSGETKKPVLYRGKLVSGFFNDWFCGGLVAFASALETTNENALAFLEKHANNLATSALLEFVV